MVDVKNIRHSSRNILQNVTLAANYVLVRSLVNPLTIIIYFCVFEKTWFKKNPDFPVCNCELGNARDDFEHNVQSRKSAYRNKLMTIARMIYFSATMD